MQVTEDMVNRFLTWSLPAAFAPDGGISFQPLSPTSWPVGTNLLTAEQARAMLEHVLDPVPAMTPADGLTDCDMHDED